MVKTHIDRTILAVTALHKEAEDRGEEIAIADIHARVLASITKKNVDYVNARRRGYRDLAVTKALIQMRISGLLVFTRDGVVPHDRIEGENWIKLTEVGLTVFDDLASIDEHSADRGHDVNTAGSSNLRRSQRATTPRGDSGEAPSTKVKYEAAVLKNFKAHVRLEKLPTVARYDRDLRVCNEMRTTAGNEEPASTASAAGAGHISVNGGVTSPDANPFISTGTPPAAGSSSLSAGSALPLRGHGSLGRSRSFAGAPATPPPEPGHVDDDEDFNMDQDLPGAYLSDKDPFTTPANKQPQPFDDGMPYPTPVTEQHTNAVAGPSNAAPGFFNTIRRSLFGPGRQTEEEGVAGPAQEQEQETVPEKMARIERRIEELEAENERLTSSNTTLSEEVEGLKGELEATRTLLTTSQTENGQLDDGVKYWYERAMTYLKRLDAVRKAMGGPNDDEMVGPPPPLPPSTITALQALGF
ncbi:hypothetical protein D9611_012476 [Ephemerocybe angulata]|uniref:Uncharacterized protein n=1 Tax=Ephemerocybe angulata TaxID=980116 RepID=A0A8H5CC00_9AGAR|nr:hypothetical protein D9611_012476 [Tulosesus angulatus]